MLNLSFWHGFSVVEEFSDKNFLSVTNGRRIINISIVRSKVKSSCYTIKSTFDDMIKEEENKSQQKLTILKLFNQDEDLEFGSMATYEYDKEV